MYTNTCVTGKHLILDKAQDCHYGDIVSFYCHISHLCVSVVTMSVSTVNLVSIWLHYQFLLSCVTFVSIWLHCHSLLSTVSLKLHCQFLLPSSHSGDTISFYCHVCHIRVTLVTSLVSTVTCVTFVSLW